ncbi:MAG: hypothetical protein EOP48_00385, partial [Sphingobacteriales bacterium]
MTGGILQLVSTSDAVQNKWLIKDPQITFFKKVYRRHTPFSTEMVKIPFDHSLNFGQNGTVNINSNGDLVSKMFFVVDIPNLNAYFTNTKSKDILNLISEKQYSNILLLNSTTKLSDFNNQVDISSLCLLLKNTQDSYDYETTARLNILKNIKTLKNTGIIPS